jgi:NAD(P)-dependent dehydrogenase (short-subunit alcohol dehydrogenase family)
VTEPVLRGRVAVITGASQGLGLEIARRFVTAGAAVLICARDEAALNSAREELDARAGQAQAVLGMPGDVCEEGFAAALVAMAEERIGPVDILVNNAGIYGPMGFVDEVPWAEWVRAVEINLMGSVLMCRAVLPSMKARRRGKIIQLSGGGATNPMPRFSAYAVSKAAAVRFAETLAHEVLPFGVQVNAIAPGALNTRLLDDVLAAGPERVGDAFFSASLKQKESGGAAMGLAADLVVFLASSAADGITGKLISAVWDRWSEWPEHVDELSNTDAYTLRRIAGRDRGLSWGDK